MTFAILAGGAATRLHGRDKGLEPLGDRPLIAWAVDAISRMDGVGGSFAGDRSGADGIVAIQAVSTPPDVLVVANRHHDIYARHAPTIGDLAPGFRGPLAGIAAALAACRSDWLLTLPVDCPEPPRDLATRLFHGMQATRRLACVAHDGERRQPLFAVYRRELADSAAAALAAGQGVSQWQDSIGAVELDFADRRRQFQNLNTPADFAAHAAERRLES